MDLSLLIIPLGAIARGVAGWLENALADGKITFPEWKKLLETVIRIGVPAFAISLGWQIPADAATGIAIFADFILVKIYNAIKNKQ